MSEERHKSEPYKSPFPPARTLKDCGHCGYKMVVYDHPFHLVEDDLFSMIVMPHPEGPIKCEGCGAVYLLKVMQDPPPQIHRGLLCVKPPDRKILTPGEAMGLVPPSANKVGH